MNLSLNLPNITIPKIRISVRVIACAVALIGIMFFYWVTNTKIPEVEAETSRLTSSNASLEKTENNLNKLYQNMTFYLGETDRLNLETEDILSEFPTFMYLEDKILYADTLLKTDLRDYNLVNFSYGQSNYVTSVTYGQQSQTMELYSVRLSGKYKDLTYPKIKELLDYGLDSPQRFVVNSITMSFNEKTGYLSGEFSFNTYFIPGQAAPYEFPQSVIDVINNGNRVNNLFGARNDAADNTDD